MFIKHYILQSTLTKPYNNLRKTKQGKKSKLRILSDQCSVT